MAEKEDRSRIRVVFYDEGGWPPNVLGGGQLARLNLMAYLDFKAFQPILLTSRDGDLAAAARERGIEVAVRPILPAFRRFPRQSLFRNPLHLARTLGRGGAGALRLSSALKELQADIVHPNENLSRAVTLLARPLHGVPSVIHIDNEWHKGLTDQVMGRLFTRGFDRLIAVSEPVRRIAEGYTRNPDKISTIPSGVALGRFSDLNNGHLRREVGATQDEYLIGTVGRLIGFKGQRLVLEQLAELNDELPPFRYLLVGVGPDKEWLKGYAQELGLEKKVEFLGYREDVPELLAGLDLLVQASMTESFGLAVVEALLAGTPVISSDVGGAYEILEGGDLGWLITAGEAGPLHEAMREALALSSQKRQEVARRGRISARERFAMETSVHRVEAVYRSLLGKDAFESRG